jgi:hypothetical protein
MHKDQRYSVEQRKAADELYEAIRRFAPKIGCVPPYLPIDDGAL